MDRHRSRTFMRVLAGGIVAAALALGACGGGNSGDLVLEDADIADIPGISGLRDGLPGDDAPYQYVVNPLKERAGE